MTNGPLVRIIYSYTCADCGREEVVRYPYNPMQETPSIVQSIPDGWSLSHFGRAIQTPISLCGCRDREVSVLN